MAKPNYQFEKRQRDLAKKQKQEEKRRQKLAGKAGADGAPDVAVTSPVGGSEDIPRPAGDGVTPKPETP